MVELLKRNHDVMMEKYELFRQRNDILEKKALDKEALYGKMKHENDEISQKYYSEMRQAEELRQAYAIIDSKLKSNETLLKQTSEQASSLKNTKE
jgi:hypothetical protein